MWMSTYEWVRVVTYIHIFGYLSECLRDLHGMCVRVSSWGHGMRVCVCVVVVGTAYVCECRREVTVNE